MLAVQQNPAVISAVNRYRAQFTVTGGAIYKDFDTYFKTTKVGTHRVWYRYKHGTKGPWSNEVDTSYDSWKSHISRSHMVCVALTEDEWKEYSSTVP